MGLMNTIIQMESVTLIYIILRAGYLAQNSLIRWVVCFITLTFLWVIRHMFKKSMMEENMLMQHIKITTSMVRIRRTLMELNQVPYFIISMVL